jgi:hypothetical protein
MGQLDDAIREHLELRRRRGADEDELHDQEQEVFGPPRPLGAEPAAPPVDPVRDPDPEPLAYEPAPPAEERVAPLEPVAPPPPLEPELRQPEPEPEPWEPEPEPPRPSARDDEPWLDEPDEVPAGEALDHRRGAVTNQPTREFSPAEEAEALGRPAPAPDSEPADPPAEDVLEETPEFLQETPEHERLWFEQKPPRDFDF